MDAGRDVRRRGGHVFSFAVPESYNAAHLVRDLRRAGIEVTEAAYEEEADVGMKYYGGTLHPDMFLLRYDSLKTCGMGGMDYTIRCALGELSFSVGCADDERGEPCGRIVFRHIPSGEGMDAILRALKERAQIKIKTVGQP